jgi:C1A family cysteine protease
MTLKIAHYGWKPDLPDHRDKMFALVHRQQGLALPPKINLKSRLPMVFDQGQLGSCTANATCWMWQFVHGPAPNGQPWSRMFTYVESLLAEDSYPNDAGAMIRDVIKVLNQKGVPPETDFPYDVAKFPKKPTRTAVKHAAADKVSVYSRLASRTDFRNCLAQGFPFVIGFSVYDSFESDVVAKTGIVPMPLKAEQMLGGHAVTVIGYDSSFHSRGFYYLVQNSWGAKWGDPANAGCFWIPAAYFENPNLADDAWTVRAG